MYFAILGKNQDISLEELELIKPQDISWINQYMITFHTQHEALFPTLWGITKRGKVVTEEELPKYLEEKKIVWVEDKKLWLKCKKEYNVRRFKIIELQKTDLEIKKKWGEIFKLPQTHKTNTNNKATYGIVLWYQNIPLYETIDFEKPSRSMQMGMMPAKFTHILINLGILNSNTHATIYDPFAGSWTTGMLTNFLWYNFIGSDIEAKHLSKNLPRRKTTNFYNPDTSLEFFQHDIKQEIPSNIIPENTIIVTEWRLWPIINKHADNKDIETAELEVIQLYRAFLATATKLKEKWKLKAIVTTIPHYFRHENNTGQELFAYGQRLWRKCNYIDEIYARPKQRVWRKILIFT